MAVVVEQQDNLSGLAYYIILFVRVMFRQMVMYKQNLRVYKYIRITGVIVNFVVDWI